MYNDSFFLHSHNHDNLKVKPALRADLEPLCNCIEAFEYNGKPSNKIREAGGAKPILTVTSGDTCKFCGNYVFWHNKNEVPTRVQYKKMRVE